MADHTITVQWLEREVTGHAEGYGLDGKRNSIPVMGRRALLSMVFEQGEPDLVVVNGVRYVREQAA